MAEQNTTGTCLRSNEEEVLQPGHYWVRYRNRPAYQGDLVDRSWKWTVAEVSSSGRWHPLRGIPGQDDWIPPEWEVIGEKLEPPHA